MRKQLYQKVFFDHTVSLSVSQVLMFSAVIVFPPLFLPNVRPARWSTIPQAAGCPVPSLPPSPARLVLVGHHAHHQNWAPKGEGVHCEGIVSGRLLFNIYI